MDRRRRPSSWRSYRQKTPPTRFRVLTTEFFGYSCKKAVQNLYELSKFAYDSQKMLIFFYIYAKLNKYNIT